MSATDDRGRQHEETDPQKSRDSRWQNTPDQHVAAPAWAQSHAGILLLAVGVLLAHHTMNWKRHLA